MSSIEHMIAAAAPQGIQINIWPCERGYQANVKETAGKGWTVSTNEDPVLALADALRHRVGGIATREIVIDPEPEQPKQIDIEEAIAATVSAGDADDFDGLLD